MLVHQKNGFSGFSCLYLFKHALSFFRRAIVVDYGSDCAYCSYRMLCLPNVSSKVYAYGAFLHAIVDEVENFTLRFGFGSACDYHGHWAAFNDLFEAVFAVIGLHDSGA
jgi:hypothetical protein